MVYHHVMIDRTTDISLVRTAIRRSRVVALLGPRQCGKTTLARQFVSADSVNYLDLEDPQSLGRLSEPDLALRRLKGLVVIDEIHRRPELLPLLRVLADRKPLPARFLVLGSAAPDLLSQSLETLAGRLSGRTEETKQNVPFFLLFPMLESVTQEARGGVLRCRAFAVELPWHGEGEWRQGRLEWPT